MIRKAICIMSLPLLVLLAGNWHAQAQPYLDTTYEFDTLSEFGNGIIVEDSSYIIAIDVTYPRSSDTISLQAGLMKVGFDGEIHWVNQLDEFRLSTIGVIDAILKMHDGEYMVFGKNNPDVNGQGRIFKFNQEGKLLWSTGVGGDGREWFQQGVQTADSQIVATGTTTSYGRGEDFWLVKFSRTGEVLWEKAYDGYEDARPFSLTATQDGGYAMVGRTESPFTEHYNGLIIKVDSSGNFEWAEKVGRSYPTAIHDVITYKGNRLVVFGSTSKRDGNKEGGQVYIGGFDLSGRKKWEYMYGPAYNYQLRKSTPVLEDSTVVVGGEFSKDGNQRGGLLMKMNLVTKEEEWVRTFSDEKDSSIGPYSYYRRPLVFDLAITPDGGYAITGSGFSGYSQNVWLAKLDSVGCDTPNCAPSTGIADHQDGREASFSLYPNPAGKQVSLQFPKTRELESKDQIQVFNRQGKQVVARSANDHSITLRTADLPSGLYLVRWVRDGRVQATEKLVIN